MKTNIVSIVWGKYHSTLFVDYCIPSLLTQENLPSWPDIKQTKLNLYTTIEDWEIMSNHPSITRLEELIDIEVISIETAIRSNWSTFNTLSIYHSHAIEKASLEKSAILFLTPDTILSKKTLTSLWEELQQGYEIIMTPGARVIDDKLLPILKKTKTSNILSLNAQQCIDFFIDCMHPEAASQFVDQNKFTNWPSLLYQWKSPNQIEVRGFHLHPLFIKHLKPYSQKTSISIDGNYLQQYFSNHEKIKVIDNSDLFVLSLTHQAHRKNYIIHASLSQQNKMLIIDRFKRCHTQPVHQYFYSHPIVYKTTKSYPEPPNNNCIHNDLELFWKLEADFEQKKYSQMIETYKKKSCLIHQNFKEPPFCFMFDLLSTAANETNNKRLYQTLQNAKLS